MSAVDATGQLGPVFALIERFVAAERVPGAALAVALAGEPVAAYQAGEAAPGRAAAADTLWPLASISKLYSATAIMALVEQGVLTLTTPVRRVLPAFTGDGRERVTLRHLLTHTAGLIYEPPAMAEMLRAQTPLDSIVDVAYEHPLLFPPGSSASYSDLGLALAGRVAAVVAGQSFPELVRSLVLAPGGLSETFMGPPASVDPRLARVVGAPAEGTAGAMYNSPYALALAHPAFGVVATVGDLLRFGLSFAPSGRPRILSAATLRTMTADPTLVPPRAQPDAPYDDTATPWSIGCYLRGPAGAPALASPASFGHEGGSGCILWVDPLADVVVAFVSNLHFNADPDGAQLRLERVVNATLACLTRPA